MKYGSLNSIIAAAKSGTEFGSPVIGFSKTKAKVICDNADSLHLFKSLCLVNRHCSLQWFKRNRGNIIETLREFRFSSLMTPSTIQLIKRLGE